MGLIDTLAARLGYAKTQPVQAPGWALASAYQERYNIPAGEDVEQQAKLFQKLTWVQIAVSTIAQTAAGASFDVKQRKGEDLVDVPNHDFELLLSKPNPLMSRFEFLEATFAYRALCGNCYWWLNRSSEDAPPEELWIIPPNKIQPVPDGKLYLKGYVYDDGTKKWPLEVWEVCHFKRFHPLNKFVGLSPIEALATVAVGDIKMQEWNTKFFGKNNAKVPGALAYSDWIDDGRWEQMKADIRRDHGGTERNLMMIRGAGSGGVSWLTMAMSQKDMEFLNARTFTKEEIFALFAPGLASVLAVNATEANSTAGMNTLLSMAIWPAHVAVAEKIGNDVLPAYGDDLVGEFEDVRQVDTAVELQEQAAYERSHSIDEVRKKYYSDDPIGDQRGILLPAEVGRGLTDARAPEDKPPPPPPPQFGGAKPPPQLPGPTGDVVEGQVVAPEAADLAKWERKALSRLKDGKRPACDFDSEHIGEPTALAIKAALGGATTAQGVRAAFVAASFQGGAQAEG
jgi:HK97 family phage portal protein